MRRQLIKGVVIGIIGVLGVVSIHAQDESSVVHRNDFIMWQDSPVDDNPEINLEEIPLPSPYPAGWIDAGGKVLVVDLDGFRIYAYQDGQLVRSDLVATGRFNMRTLPGNFAVESRIEVSDLAYRGNVAEGVPYILVYDGRFAIHGAYWHNQWGERASSGCVNLPVETAAWYFGFAEIGTPVIIVD